MSPDDIDSVVLKLHDFMANALGYDLDEDTDYDLLRDFMHDALDQFCTKDRNYN